jgi:hypothetical protein
VEKSDPGHLPGLQPGRQLQEKKILLKVAMVQCRVLHLQAEELAVGQIIRIPGGRPSTTMDRLDLQTGGRMHHLIAEERTILIWEAQWAHRCRKRKLWADTETLQD